MDTIGDMLTRIRNAQVRNHDEVIIPFSKIKYETAKLLKKEGYVGELKKMEKDNKKDIKISLLYNGTDPKINGLKRVSKPGCRVYKKSKDLHPVLNGIGIAVISTSKGVISDKEARKNKLGGEVICEIY